MRNESGSVPLTKRCQIHGFNASKFISWKKKIDSMIQKYFEGENQKIVSRIRRRDR